MSNPCLRHIQEANLKGTRFRQLYYWTLGTKLANVLVAWADADHVRDPDTGRSVTGYVIMRNGAAVLLQSVRQQVTELSSAEAQHYAGSVTSCEISTSDGS